MFNSVYTKQYKQGLMHSRQPTEIFRREILAEIGVQGSTEHENHQLGLKLVTPFFLRFVLYVAFSSNLILRI